MVFTAILDQKIRYGSRYLTSYVLLHNVLACRSRPPCGGVD